MAIFQFWSKSVDLNRLKIYVLSAEVPFTNKDKKIFQQLNNDQAWELVKSTLAGIDRIKGRDLIRLLFSDKDSFLKEKIKDREERVYVIECLGYLPSRSTVEILIQLLKHKEGEVQMYAAGALKNHTPRLVVPYLIRGLLDQTILPARLCEVFVAMGYLGEEKLLEIYPQVEVKIQGQIIEILTSTRNPKCKNLVVQALQSEDNGLKYKAIEAIAAMGFKELWEEVARSLSERDWRIKNKALQVLAKLEIVDARNYIKPLLDDDDELIREYAQDCLCQLEKLGVSKVGR